ncbi:MAG TPA: hypothetical protein PLU81_10215 [Deltaproteobacteria bacterium]|nr:hypothetical protein [Deltaproteobacteria bacterium]HPR52151.1 hypothetical protein [Deltaproteobacteria bacterium]
MNRNDGHCPCRNNMQGHVLLLWIMIYLALPVSCTTTRPASIDTQLSTREGDEQIREGLRIYMRPLEDAAEIKKYFGTNLIEKDILPVFVLAENRTGSEYFLVEPADRYPTAHEDKDLDSIGSGTGGTEYMSATQAKKSVYTKDTSLETSLIMTGPVFWLAIVPLSMTDYGPTDASKSLQQALITQSLRKQTLAPGRTESGFLYYHLPEDATSAGTVGINLKATNLETQHIMYFRFMKELKKEDANVKAE